MPFTIGSLFTGYDGIGLALDELASSIFAAPRTLWVSENDKHANIAIRKLFGDTPNLGDITRANWRNVEPVDIITGGSPCQDLSSAGKQAGMNAGTRSGLWESMRQGIETLKPPLVIWENVKGALYAHADSRMETERGRLGEGHYLRALGRVLGDLAALGYDAQWLVRAASEVGAPHKRDRVFLLAHLPNNERAKHVLTLLSRREIPLNPNPHRLLPTALRNTGECGAKWSFQRDRLTLVGHVSGDIEPFRPALNHWANIIGRPAPAPLDNEGCISARFTEWMMGLPDGYVSSIPGISRRRAVMMHGNGVCPQQAASAINELARIALEEGL